MGRLVVGIVGLAVILLVGGAIWLSVSDMKPAPQTVHLALPDASFPR